jgi:beta-glucosidase
VADVLFGNVNPSGKLPVTFYRSDSQLPDYEDYSMKGRTYRYFSDPLFAFGYGLSYTTFELGKASLNGSISTESGALTLSVPVRNTGHRDGTEIVQLYIRNLQDANGPLKSLRAFQRVDVKAGQTATATLKLNPSSFEFFDTETNTMLTKAGRYELLYGNSSQDSHLQRMEITLQ